MSNAKLLVLKQGISTSDDLGLFSFSFDPLQHSVPPSTGPWLIDPSPEERMFLDSKKYEPITFLVKLRPIGYQPNVEPDLRIAGCHVTTRWRSPRTLSHHLAESIAICDLNIKFRCNEDLMKVHITPMSQQYHGNSLQVFFRLSQPACMMNWTICRQVSLPLSILSHEARSSSWWPSANCCLVT